MKAKKSVIVLMFLLFAGIAYADIQPTISLTAQPGTTVNVTIVLNVIATDLIDPPMIAGIREIKLYEDGNLYDTYNCGGQTVCTYSKSITYMTPGNRTYYATAKDKGDNIVQSPSRIITFLGPNWPPVIQTLPNPSINEDSGDNAHLINLWNYTSDDRNSAGNLTYTITYQENQSIANCVIENNQYINCSTPTLNLFGTSIVEVQAFDGQLYDKENFTITVESVNDVPWLNATLPNITFPEDTYNDSENLSYYFKDIETAYLDYSFIPFNTNLTVTETAGIMNITSALNYFGNSSLIIIASDGENSTNTTMYVMVSPVNDIPYFDPLPQNQTTIRDLLFTYDINASDVDIGDILTFYDNSTQFTINSSTGLISFTPLTQGNYSINITVCDDSGAVNDCTSRIFNLEVIYIPRPGFVNNTPLNATYTDPGYYELFITIVPSSTIDTVLFDFNGINTTATHVSGNTYKANLSNLPAGTYNYRWHANYTNTLSNTSQTYMFTIFPATPQLILDIQPGTPVEYGTITNVSCYSNTSQSQALNLYRNGFIIINPDVGMLSAGLYNYTCFLAASQNHTSILETKYLNITKKTVNMTLNAPATPLPYGTITNINCTIDTNLTTPTLTRNGTIIPNPEITQLAAGTYNYSCYVLQSTNFNPVMQTTTVTITKQQGTATLNAPASITYGNPMNVNCSVNNNQSILQFQRNGTSITSPDLGPLAAGQYNYTCNAIESQNYTGDSKAATLIVNQATPVLNLTLSGNASNIYLPANYTGFVSINANLVTPSTGYAELELYLNNTLNQTNTTGTITTVSYAPTGSVPVTFVYNATQNYSQASVTYWIFVGISLSRNFAPPINTFFNKSYFTLNLTTNLNTSCNWSFNPLNINNLFNPTGQTFHQASITGMGLGQNNVYVACSNDSIVSNLSYTVQNIIELGSTLLNGATASSSILYSTTVDNSTLTNVNATGSTIRGSNLANCVVINSTVKNYRGTNCIIINSFVDPPNPGNDLTGSTITGNSRVMNSNVTYSTIQSSNITNSNINNSNMTDSELILVSMNNSNIMNSTLYNVTLINATVTNGVLTNGTLIYNGTSYTAPQTIANITNLPPTAAFSITTSNPTAGSAVSFNAQASSDPNNDILTYDWTWGDGSNSTNLASTITSHTYSTEGTYNVTLIVIDSHGVPSTPTTQTITISTPSSPPPAPPGGSSGGGGGGGGRGLARTYTYDLDSGMHFQRSLSSYDTLIIKYKNKNHTFKISALTRDDVLILLDDTASRLVNEQIQKYDLDNDHYYDMEAAFVKNYAVRAEFRLRPVQELVPGYSPYKATTPTKTVVHKTTEPTEPVETEEKAEETTEEEPGILSKFWQKAKGFGVSITGAVAGVTGTEEIGGTTGWIILLAVIVIGIFLYWIHNEWF